MAVILSAVPLLSRSNRAGEKAAALAQDALADRRDFDRLSKVTADKMTAMRNNRSNQTHLLLKRQAPALGDVPVPPPSADDAISVRRERRFPLLESGVTEDAYVVTAAATLQC